MPTLLQTQSERLRPAKTAQTNHQPPTSSSSGSYQNPSIVLSSRDRPRMPAHHETAPSAHLKSTFSSHAWSPRDPVRLRLPVHNTTQHDHEMIALSQDPTRPRRPRDDRDYLPPLSSSNPSFENMGSHQHQHHGKQSLQLYRSMSMDTQGPRLDSPSRMTRMPSALSLGHGPQPTGTQFDSGLASGTSQIPAERQEHGSHFPSSLQSKLSNDFRCVVRCRVVSRNNCYHRFRILVAGKVCIMYPTDRRRN